MVPILQSAIYKLSKSSCQLFRKFHCHPFMCSNTKLKADDKVLSNPNSFGPLTNLPDYSFTDNRTVPYGTGQKRRIDKQRELLIKMKTLVGEIDYAVEKHEKLKMQIEQEKQNIINMKLKKKGTKVLQEAAPKELKPIVDEKSSEDKSTVTES